MSVMNNLKIMTTVFYYINFVYDNFRFTKQLKKTDYLLKLLVIS